MSIITQCPSCGTTFRVTPPQLQAQHGMVRCGRCAQIFDGFKTLATLPDTTPPEAAPVGATPAEATQVGATPAEGTPVDASRDSAPVVAAAAASPVDLVPPTAIEIP